MENLDFEILKLNFQNLKIFLGLRNESGPKWVGAQMSRGPNESGPKWVGAQMCWGPNESGPKCVGAQMSWGPNESGAQMSGAQTSQGLNEEWAQMCPSLNLVCAYIFADSFLGHYLFAITPSK